MKANIAMLGLGVVGLFLGGCTTAPVGATQQVALHSDTGVALMDFKQRDPGLDGLLDRAYGYVVFPDVGKGGAGAGAAYGRGEVYERGQLIGYATMTQATIGPQIGGQEYSEVIVFETPGALEHFKAGAFTFSAQVSAVAIQAGAAEVAKYHDGVAIFVDTKGGLMSEASVGGQQFMYQPV